MCNSVTPVSPSVGMSTSSTSRAAKTERICWYRSALCRSASRSAQWRQSYCAAMNLSVAGAAEVLTGSGIHAHHFADVEEQRHLHGRAGAELGRLGTAGGGVAAQARIGLHDLEFHVVCGRHRQRRAVVQRDPAGILLLEPERGITDTVLVGQIGRASCRESVEGGGGGGRVNKRERRAVTRRITTR